MKFFPAVLVVLLGLSAVSAVTVTDLFATAYPESAVTTSDAIYVSNYVSSGTGAGISKFVREFDVNGTATGAIVADSAWTSPSIIPRGLVINDAESKLWAAVDGRVEEYTIGTNSLTLVNYYNTSIAKPNGLCLNADETHLFVTDPGKALGNGVIGDDGTNGLVSIKLSDGTESVLFSGEAGLSPNGCKVSGDLVWLINFQNGVSKVQISTGDVHPTEDWSVNVEYKTVSEVYAGDGIVMWDDKLYVSFWKYTVSSSGASSSGEIWSCDMISNCTKYVDAVAADLDVDDKFDTSGRLLLPDLIGQKVRSSSLPLPDIPLDGAGSAVSPIKLLICLVVAVCVLFG